MIHKLQIKFAFLFIGFLSAFTEAYARDTLTLIEAANGLDNFNQVGEGDWRVEDDFIEINSGEGGPSYLVTKDSYDNFSLDIEFWSSDDANSGIFMRCQNPEVINDKNCYEANIFDQRPDKNYATGGIVNIALAPDPIVNVGGKWNRYQITLDGDNLLVILNGEKTVEASDSTLASGHIALQWAQGIMRFRKFEITPIGK